MTVRIGFWERLGSPSWPLSGPPASSAADVADTYSFTLRVTG
jgi:hypothetical protein